MNAELEEWQAKERELEAEDVADIRKQEYREASEHFMRVFNRALQMIIDAPNSLLAAWQVAYAIGADVCGGVSMTERARSVGVTRACFSKGAVQFLDASNLPPSKYMKDGDSAGSYADSRQKQLK